MTSWEYRGRKGHANFHTAPSGAEFLILAAMVGLAVMVAFFLVSVPVVPDGWFAIP